MLYQLQYFVLFSPRYFREKECDKGYEILSITSDDGVELEGAIYRRQDAKSTILFFGGREQDSVGLISRLAIRHKYSTIITFNYRSYGRSKGSLNEKNIFSDALKISKIVQKNYGDFYILGYSLGASVALYVASQIQSRGVFLVGAFDSLASLAKQKFRVNISWFLKYTFDNIEFLKSIDAKIYIFASTADEVVSSESSQNLKNGVKNLGFFKNVEALSHRELFWSDEVCQGINEILK
jgi:alpha/beta superfamily hydrolase